MGSVGETDKWDNTPHSKKHAPHTCTALLHAHACCAAEATIAFHRPVPRPRKDHLQSVSRLTILSYPICAELVVAVAYRRAMVLCRTAQQSQAQADYLCHAGGGPSAVQEEASDQGAAAV